jgi:hypothetical protein
VLEAAFENEEALSECLSQIASDFGTPVDLLARALML